MFIEAVSNRHFYSCATRLVFLYTILSRRAYLLAQYRRNTTKLMIAVWNTLHCTSLVRSYQQTDLYTP
jgi:hypothetical protein